MLEVVVERDSDGAPRTTLWFCVPALAIMVLPVFAGAGLLQLRASARRGALVRRRAAGHVHDQRVPHRDGLPVLLGNLRDAPSAVKLAIVLGGAASSSTACPTTHPPSRSSLVFGISWLAGFALRGPVRAGGKQQARAIQAERESGKPRPASPSPKKRARIARELHDIVAHAVSVMVTRSRGGEAPRRARRRSRSAPRGRADGPLGARRDAAAPRRANARSSDGLELGPSRASPVSTCSSRKWRANPYRCTWTASPPPFHPRSTSRRIASSRKASRTRSSTPARVTPT